MTWLCELISDAQASPRLNEFEAGFIDSIDRKLIRFGSAVTVTEPQMAVLRQIEEKIHAAG